MENYINAVKHFKKTKTQLSEAYSHDWLNEDGVIAYKVADAVTFLSTFARGGEEMAKMLEEEADQAEKEFYILTSRTEQREVAEALRKTANGFRRIGG